MRYNLHLKLTIKFLCLQSGVNELESLVPVYAMNTCIFVHDKCTNTGKVYHCLL